MSESYVDMKKNYEKILGSLLGLHTGDSLGSTLEFCKPSDTQNKPLEMIGGGVFKWNPGDATDDTDLMMVVLRSLVNLKKFNLNNIANNFVKWYNKKPKDIGNTTAKAFYQLKKGVSPLESGVIDEEAQGNGSIMRMAPLALGIVDVNYSDMVSHTAITHNNDVCINVDLVFSNALSMAVEGCGKQDIYQATLDSCDAELRAHIIESVESDWDSLKNTGWAVHTLGVAMWALMKTESFEDGLTAIVNRGDDADTGGAVTGALLGAYYGINSIPKRWVSHLQYKEEITYLINKAMGIENPRYVIGDATQPIDVGHKIICHVCNDIGGWGSGFVVAVSKKWLLPEEMYRKWVASIPFDNRLGKIQYVEVEPEITIANMIAQRDVMWNNGIPPIRYDAVRKCLKELAIKAKELNASVHCPRFGAGLAGGSWDAIEELIIKELALKGINVTVYDLEEPQDIQKILSIRKNTQWFI